MAQNPVDRFNRPEAGTEDWHEPLNENFAKLGTEVEIRDEEAALDNYQPKDGAKFLATDTGAMFLGTIVEETGDSIWRLVKMTGENPEFNSVTSNKAFYKNNNGVMYAREFDGDDLSEKIENALAALTGGQGRIRVTARDDGQPWQWNNDLTVNTPNYEGVHIDVDDNVIIEYTGSGVMITFDQDGKHTDDKKRAILTGGHWEATADPEGWCRLKDTILARVAPSVVDFRGGTTPDSTFGVSLENHDRWAESNYISGKYFAGVGIDSVPVSETGGTNGTDSFHGTRIEDVHIHPSNIGIRCRGNWDFCNFRHPEIFLYGDDAIAIYLDNNRGAGTVVSALKVEQPVGSDGVAIVTGPNFSSWEAAGSFTFLGGDWHGMDQYQNDGANGHHRLYRVGANGMGVFDIHDIRSDDRVRFDGNSLTAPGFDGNSITANSITAGSISVDDTVRYIPVDVRDVGSPLQGYVAYHDGSGENTEGPAFYNGTAWVSQVDGNIIS